MQTWLLSIKFILICVAHISSKCGLARLKLVTNVPVLQSTWKHTHDTHTCLIPGNLTVESLSRSLSIQQFTSVCSFSHALWSLSVGVLPDTVAGAFLPWKEKWWRFSINFIICQLSWIIWDRVSQIWHKSPSPLYGSQDLLDVIEC